MKNHRLVARMLVKDHLNQFLLVRNPDQDFWYPPGGGVEIGETLAEAATREVMEETGVRARVERLLFVLEFWNSELAEHNVETFFLGFCEAKSGHDSELPSRWFKQNEMVNNASIFPKCLREPDWGGTMQVNQNLYLGLERG